jgi:hypothetical protein
MPHLVGKHTIARGNLALMHVVLWGALAGTAVAALIFDIRRWVM